MTFYVHRFYRVFINTQSGNIVAAPTADISRKADGAVHRHVNLARDGIVVLRNIMAECLEKTVGDGQSDAGIAGIRLGSHHKAVPASSTTTFALELVPTHHVSGIATRSAADKAAKDTVQRAQHATETFGCAATAVFLDDFGRCIGTVELTVKQAVEVDVKILEIHQVDE